jgi:ribosomal protein S27AE
VASNSQQRAYRAACPGCGAPVEFRSAASASAVCSFCRSTLVRDGDALQRIGVSSELFDDHSPLQLGAGGTHQGLAFTLVGRLQYGYSSGPRPPASPSPPEAAAGPAGTAGSNLDGTWNEWHALFDNGPDSQRSGWLSEDNGAYVLSFDAPLDIAAPKAEELRVGERRIVGGIGWDVASVTTARLIAAQGELPSAPKLQGAFVTADLRNPRGEVGTLDYSTPAKPHWSIGRGVTLGELAMSGLRETSEKTLGARNLACPSCGASLAVTLASTQSIVCGQCKSVVDVAQKAGSALGHYQQNNAGRDGAEPTLPLGATATLKLSRDGPLPWTVVGMVERCDLPEDSDEETSFWREYLLYNLKAGFAFVVDAEDGWSSVRPITGAPQVRGMQAQWQGVSYAHRYTYLAKVTWVQGEFYWRVQRDERARVSDYHAGRKRLSREQTGSEVAWSAGEAIDAAVLAKAFGVPIASSPVLGGDALPLSQLKSIRSTFIWIFVALIAMMMILDSCSDDCDDVRSTFGAGSAEYQQCKRSGGSGVRGGGSSGGWSSGGGHK